MFINFGKGRCPLCGESGLEKRKDIYFCKGCEITFSEFCFEGIPRDRTEEVECT